MVSCLVALAISHFQVTDPRVDFECKGMAVGSMLERLSAQVKAPLKTKQPIEGQMVFVKAKGVALSALKSNIAKTLQATWVKRDDGEYLERTPDQTQAVWDAHIARREKLVEDALAKAKKELEVGFDAKALARGLTALKPREEFQDNPAEARKQYEQERALFNVGPMARLLRKLILACNPKDLASLPPHSRRIFAFKPTRMQFKIGEAGFRSAMASFAKEQQAWIDAAAASPFPEERNGRMVSDPRAQLQIPPNLGDDLLLEIRRGEMAVLFNVNLLSDKAEMGQRIITQADFADPARTFLNDLGNGQRLPDDPKVRLSPDSIEFQNRMAEVFGGREANPPSPKMLEMLIGIDQNDPVGWAVSDSLSAYADSKQTNVVAVLPDTAVAMTTMVSGSGDLKLNSFIRALIASGTLELHEEGEWTTFTHPDTWEAEQDFTPRKPVGELVRMVHSKGVLDVRDYARYAFQSRKNSRSGLGGWWLGLYDRSLMGSSDYTDWDGLRLYGSFDAQAQRDLEAGKRFPLAGLSQEQRRIIDRIVYAGEIRSEERLESGSSQLHHAPVEPTEAFPNGVPAGLTVVGRSKSTPTIVAYGRTSDGKVRPLRSLNVWTLAAIETDVVGNQQRMANYGVPNLVGYAPGNDKLVSVRVELAPGIWKEATIVVPERDPQAKPVSWDKLPEPMRKEIAAAIEQRKAQKGTSGGAPPPR